MQRAARVRAGDQRNDIALRAGRVDQGRRTAGSAIGPADATVTGMQQDSPGMGHVTSGQCHGASTFKILLVQCKRSDKELRWLHPFEGNDLQSNFGFYSNFIEDKN